MNDIVRKSLIANVTGFTKDLTDLEVKDLVGFICYMPSYKPTLDIDNDVQRKFVDEILGSDEWSNYIGDLIKLPIFLKSSGSFRTNLEFIEKILHSEAYFRFENVLNNLKKEKAKLPSAEKTILKNILDEHKAMLEYQLEDEDFIRNCDNEGEEFIDEKRRHLKFLEEFKISKYIK